jgi:polyphenol oxidase
VTVRFRDAVPGDAEALSRLGAQSFTETFGHLYSAENLDLFLHKHAPEAWAAELRDPQLAIRIGEPNGEAVGYAKIGPPTLPFDPGGTAAELRQLYVLKPWQGTGAATCLMNWVLEQARRGAAEELYLSVFVDNHRARRFYERFGFRAVGRYDFMVGTHADEDIIMQLKLNAPDVLQASALTAVPHGFLGRRGGVSEGLLWGLNCGHGSGDDPERIAENRRRACEAVLPGAELAIVYQVHSDVAVQVDTPWPEPVRPHADAMVTDRPNILLGILTADCAPVLLADPAAGVVGAAHAGWRGALAGVVERTVALMESLGARREAMVAAVGPCIAQRSYEVDPAFQHRFVEADAANAEFFRTGPNGRPHFDLQGFVRSRLAAAGVGTIEAVALDTYATADRFFSYRRSSKNGEPSYGRQLSVIGLKP